MSSYERTPSGLIVPSSLRYEAKRNAQLAKNPRKPIEPTISTFDHETGKLMAVLADGYIKVHRDDNPPHGKLVRR